MNKVVFDPIPINPNSLTSKLLGNQTQSDKYLRVSSSVSLSRFQLLLGTKENCECIYSRHFMSVSQFRKSIQSRAL